MPSQLSTMTPRERWVAAVKMEPVNRLPFWPKLGSNYRNWQSAPFKDMKDGEVHDWVGSDRHEYVGNIVKESRRSTKTETSTDGTRRRTVYTTPYGEMEMHLQYDGPSDSWHPVIFPVQNRQHIEWMTKWHEDATVELDTAALEKANARAAEIDQTGIIATGIGESPLMNWVEHFAGIENAHYLLADYPEEVEALFDAMHEHLLARARIICEHSPADIIYMVENTSTTLISPEQYRRFCFKHIMDYATIAQQHGRLMVLHMCGHLKKVLPDLAKLPVAAFEAFTSPTLGNTSLLDGRTACPGKCLIGGTNAMLWLKPAAEIIAKLEQDLDALPHHRGIVPTSAGVMPPICKPETIKAVCDWVKTYPARMQ